ncbi:Protein translation factor SUI1, partial [Sarracenia purpurea var. burkii]
QVIKFLFCCTDLVSLCSDLSGLGVSSPTNSRGETLTFGSGLSIGVQYLKVAVFVSVQIYKPSFMSELDIQIPTAFDPFAEANAEDSGAGSKEYVHIRIQQRNGRKSLTTVQGLKKEFSYNKILKDLKKEFCCNGTVVQDPELGQVIQLQGDQRKNVSTFLVQAGIVKKEHIKIHGF